MRSLKGCPLEYGHADVGRTRVLPAIAAALDRRGLLGVDLVTVREVAAVVQP
jgi:hypothetical protein